jgi:hypothetical protein
MKDGVFVCFCNFSLDLLLLLVTCGWNRDLFVVPYCKMFFTCVGGHTSLTVVLLTEH